MIFGFCYLYGELYRSDKKRAAMLQVLKLFGNRFRIKNRVKHTPDRCKISAPDIADKVDISVGTSVGTGQAKSILFIPLLTSRECALCAPVGLIPSLSKHNSESSSVVHLRRNGDVILHN